MDSVTLAYRLRHLDPEGDLILVSVDYGQRHRKELDCARLAAEALDCEHVLVDLTSITPLLSGSALTDPTVDVPEGHYAWDTMKATVVPNRNAILLSVATGIAVARGAEYVATGVHAGDHAVYPDCRPEFISRMSSAMQVANDGFAVPGFSILAPFVHMTKTDIAAIGRAEGVPWEDTWSCYVGGDVHCGACGTCYERREALRDAGIDDPTEYAATPEFSE
jgi:7-cyano-7-deazaguanine synthase